MEKKRNGMQTVLWEHSLVDLANKYFVYGLGIASCNIAYINVLYCISLDEEGLHVCLLQNLFSK